MENKSRQNSRHAPTLSIIICVYNVDFLYLEECLDSIVKGIPRSSEIIIVDDGSTKKYTPLIEKHNVRYIRTENMGLLHARVTGIVNAKSDYIAFVDADDKLSRCYHKPMLDAAIASGADVVIGEWAYLTNGGARAHESDLFKSEGVLYDSALLALLETRCRDHTYFVMWNKIFRAALLRKCVSEILRLRLDKRGITYGEDILFSYFIYKNSGHILPCSSGFYMYRIHSAQSVQGGSRERISEQIRSLSTVLRAMEEYEEDERCLTLIREWQRFSSRHHYSAARAAGYKDLYPIVRESYGAEKLKRKSRRDAKAYLRCEALGQNFSEIDRALKQIYDTGAGIEVFYEKKCKYIDRILSSYEALLSRKFKTSRGHTVTIPRRELSVRDRIVSSHFLMKAANIIIPTQSKIRAALKRIFTL